VAIYTRKQASRIAGQARQEAMTDEERVALASSGGTAYWSRLTVEQRSDEMKRRARVRKPRRKKKRAKKAA